VFPACFAYSILRNRLLDIRLVIRQGARYAVARGALLWSALALGVILVADLLVHGDQPLILILEERGGVYAALGTMALAVHSQRRRWGEAIDRRFFREHYDAHRLLHEVAAERGRARGLADAAPGVVARIETAPASRPSTRLESSRAGTDWSGDWAAGGWVRCTRRRTARSPGGWR
jgi:hypothetical protein